MVVSVGGVIGPLLGKLGKLGKLLKDEYGLEEKVRGDIKNLEVELKMMHEALSKVADVPRDQLDGQVRIWAGMLRELSYDMEDAVDGFLVRVEGGNVGTDEPAATSNLKKRVNKLLKRTTRLFTKGKKLHQIANAIQQAQDRARNCAELREKYMLDFGTVNINAGAAIHPRVEVLLNKDATNKLVGVEHRIDELIEMLSAGDEVSSQPLRSVSIVGIGGLGKTTLAKAVYDKIKAQFVCSAFVSVSRNPDVINILKKILYQLDDKYNDINEAKRDAEQLITELYKFLTDKRYIIVIDDIWRTSAWRHSKAALVDSNCGSRVIATTRISEVAKKVGDVYVMKPLSEQNSKRLLYTIIGIECIDQPDNTIVEATKKILKKCNGVPLSIITIASLLAHNKPIENWSKVYDSIGFGLEDNENEIVQNTRKILSFSYYDLPSDLKACMLYLSIYPEDYWIDKNCLIWRWIAEGFVQKKENMLLFEIGETYFTKLINRNMIQPMVDEDTLSNVNGCVVHDMVLDLIRILAKEENFVVHENELEEPEERSIVVRRLALHKKMEDDKTNKPGMGMAQLRSFNAFKCPISMMPLLVSFKILRVLVLERCKVPEGCQFKHLGKLLQLRYLALRYTRISEFPKEIGDLRHIQALDLIYTRLKTLPITIGKLTKLMRLWITGDTRVPSGVGTLTSLQELSLGILTDESCPNFVGDLRKLTELRRLEIDGFGKTDDASLKALVESIHSIRKIQELDISFSSGPLVSSWEDWEPPCQLRVFSITNASLPRVPAWVNPYHLTDLSIHVLTVETRDLNIIAKMPELCYLDLFIKGRTFSWTVDGGKSFFPNLRCLWTNIAHKFLPGSMPRLVRAHPWIPVSKVDATNDVGLCNLLSLKHICITLDCKGATARQVEESEEALKRAIHAHPNHPAIFSLDRWQEHLIKKDNDDGDDPEESSAPEEMGRNDEEEEIPAMDQQFQLDDGRSAQDN